MNGAEASITRVKTIRAEYVHIGHLEFAFRKNELMRDTTCSESRTEDL